MPPPTARLYPVERCQKQPHHSDQADHNREHLTRLDVVPAFQPNPDARFCAGESGAERQLEAQAFEGTAQLHKLYDLAGFLRRGKGRPGWGASLIDDISRLGLLLLSWLRVEGGQRNHLEPAAGACLRAEQALQDGKASSGEPVAITATGAARPLAAAISRTLRAIRETLAGTAARGAHDAGEASRWLLAVDAFGNPEHVRFALKVTLAVMTCYFVMNMTHWPGIHTSVITAFFVALGPSATHCTKRHCALSAA
jgi:hypothetical protein